MPDPSILWIASYLRHPSGNSTEYRALLRALELAGLEPSALELSGCGGQVGDGQRTVELDADTLRMIVRQIERTPTEPIVAVHAYTPKPKRRDAAHPRAVNVARCMFETDRLPDGWAGLLESRARVWVPSEHNREIFTAGGVPAEKIRLLGETLDFDAFHPAAEPYDLGVPEGHVTFLTSFDFSERKGWRDLLLGWARAFEPHDPVCLVLKTLSAARWDEDYARERIEHFVEKRLGRRRMAPIRILSMRLPEPMIPGLYTAADAYVSVSRGEAWGRTYMEALATGLPTIASGWGGNTDFMRAEESHLIGGELVPVPPEAEVVAELYRGHRWFQADADELASALRAVASDPHGSRNRAAGARDRLIGEFGPEPTARRVMELAREALGAHSPVTGSA